MAGIDVVGNRYGQCSRVLCCERSLGVGKVAFEEGSACCVGSAKYYHMAMYYKLCAADNFSSTRDYIVAEDVRGDQGVAAVCCDDWKGGSSCGGSVSSQAGGDVEHVETFVGGCGSNVGVLSAGSCSGAFGSNRQLHDLRCGLSMGCKSTICGFQSACCPRVIGGESGNGNGLGVCCSHTQSAGEIDLEVPSISSVHHGFGLKTELNGNVGQNGVCPECKVLLSRIGGCDCVVKLKNQNSIESCVFSTAETKLERNRRWREERKQKKKQRQFLNKDWRRRSFESSASIPVFTAPDQPSFSETFSTEKSKNDDLKALELRATLEEKWKVQNQLATERAKRELEVLKATDIEQEVKQYRTKVSAATERNMVSIERTHAKLRETGNLPEERGGGFAETVVSGGQSGTISPDSSASMSEFRACQKALLDAENEIAEYKRKIAIAKEKYHVPVDLVDYLEKEVWTNNKENSAILDELYPDGYGKNTSYVPDGYFVPC